MTSYDLLLFIATVCLVFLTGFACAVLYYLLKILQAWHRFSREMEEQVQSCLDHFQAALHSLASLKTIGEIALQTLKTASTVYTTAKKSTRTKRSSAQSEDTE